MDFHSILGKLRAIESLGTRGIDSPLHEMDECNMTPALEECPVHGLEECPGYAGTIQLEDSRGEMMDEKSSTDRDDHAEKAGHKVAHDIEYDERHKDHIHGHKRSSEDDKAERAGEAVTKDIEWDDEKEMEEDAPLGPPPFSGPGATNNGPDTAGYVYAYSESQKQLRESMNIVMSQNIDDQGSHKSMTVTATDEDFETLERLLAMSGIGSERQRAEVVVAPQAGMPYGVSAEHACPNCGNPAGQCTCEQVAMENADYDHGHEEQAETGEPVDPKDYIWNGDHINQRFGKIGDNTLMAERADSLFAALNEQYTDYLIEAELETSNAGFDSPLTANSRDTFDKDPFADEEPVTDGSRSPLSHIGRQDVMN